MIEWQSNQSDAAASGRNRAAGSAVCERHASVICCTAGAMSGRSQTARTEATVSRVIFAEATTRSPRSQPESAAATLSLDVDRRQRVLDRHPADGRGNALFNNAVGDLDRPLLGL